MKPNTILLEVRNASHWLPGGTPKAAADFYRAPVSRVYKHDAPPYALGRSGGPRLFINGAAPRVYAVFSPLPIICVP